MVVNSVTFFTCVSIWKNCIFYKTKKVLGIRKNTVNLNIIRDFCPPKNGQTFPLVAFMKFNVSMSNIFLLQLFTWWLTWFPELCLGCNITFSLAGMLQSTVHYVFVKLLQRCFRDSELQNISVSFHVRQDIPSLNTSHSELKVCVLHHAAYHKRMNQ